MLHLWGRTSSANVMKVVWLLDELALPFRRTDAGLAFGHVDTAEYRAMNPFGLVPVLQDGQAALFESNAILRYLCNTRAPDSAWYPAAPAARAAVEAWMDAQQTSLAPPLGIVFGQLIRTAPEQRNETLLAQSLARCGDSIAVLDRALQGREYLAGDGLSLAEIAFGPWLHRWFGLPIARPDTPNLRALYQRLLQRPAYVTNCAGKLA